MNFLHHRLFYLITFTIVGGCSDLFSIGGFERLYNPENGMTIDILYDTHLHNQLLTPQQMYSADPAFIEQCLDPSEIKFIEVLRTINNRGRQASLDLIWEHGYERPGFYTDQFIALSERLIERQFRNISFIPSDLTRRAFMELLSKPALRPRRGTDSLGWCSFDTPMELPDQLVAQIVGRSGDHAWREFKELYTIIMNQLRGHLRADYLAGKDFGQDLYTIGFMTEVASLTDLEMLSHILASSKKQVIVFAGSWHASHLSKFLVERLNCRRVHSFGFAPHQRLWGESSIEELNRMKHLLSQEERLPSVLDNRRDGNLFSWYARTYQGVD